MGTSSPLILAGHAADASRELRKGLPGDYPLTKQFAEDLEISATADFGVADNLCGVVAACGYAARSERRMCVVAYRELIAEMKRADELDKNDRDRLEYFLVTLTAHFAFGAEKIRKLSARS